MPSKRWRKINTKLCDRRMASTTALPYVLQYEVCSRSKFIGIGKVQTNVLKNDFFALNKTGQANILDYFRSLSSLVAFA